MPTLCTRHHSGRLSALFFLHLLLLVPIPVRRVCVGRLGGGGGEVFACVCEAREGVRA